MRDLFKTGFTAEDFDDITVQGNEIMQRVPKEDAARLANNLLREAIENAPKVMVWVSPFSPVEQAARAICIEEIEK
jgi:hypothetical protein